MLNYDFQRAITPEFKAENDWMVKQFAKIGIQLEIRATDFNQFQDKTLKGKHQIFWAGWLADYPDAENFLFLLYGPNAKSKSNGENVANYENPRFDALFRELQTLDDTPRKQSGDRRDGGHRPAGRAVVVRLHPVGRPGVPAVGPQRQAEHPDPRHGEVLPRRPGAARAHAGRVEPPDRAGRWCCPCWRCWRLLLWALAQLAGARERHGPTVPLRPRADPPIHST